LGASFGNAAATTGSFDIADGALATINAGAMASYGSISNLTMTVSGADTGNVVFTTNNFVTFLFRTPSALDFSRQLVGQPLTGGTTFGQVGQAGLAGDFTFFSILPHTPTALATFTLGRPQSGCPNGADLTDRDYRGARTRLLGDADPGRRRDRVRRAPSPPGAAPQLRRLASHPTGQVTRTAERRKAVNLLIDGVSRNLSSDVQAA
jgi:hypothetical protein